MELVRSRVALEPNTGTRVDAFSCVECGAAWLLAMSPEGEVVDWFRGDEPA